MSAPSEACKTPFSNGTEGHAWMSTWCAYCAHDHGAHDETYDPQCLMIGGAMIGGQPWPEAWLPEPDDGRFFLPSRMTCAAFTPCSEGECCGDPGADERAERVQEVAVYWRNRVAAGDL